MEKKIVSFKGISNVPDDGLNEAGDMAVLMNMRHKGGELVPCQPPAVTPVSDDIIQAMYHANSERWIYLYINGKLEAEQKMSSYKFVIDSGVTSFDLMGNMIVISFNDRVEYAIWKSELGRYVYLGGVPEMPRLEITLRKEKVKVVSSNWGSNPNESNYNLKYQKGNIDQALATVYQEKGYVDRAWFRLGIRLFDGSYINAGEIYELSIFPNMGKKDSYGDVTEKIIGVQDWWMTDGNLYYTELTYFVPTFKLYNTGSLGNWADLIASVDLLSTGSIMSVAPGMATTDDDPNGPPPGIEIYKYRTPEQMKDALMGAVYYKVAEFEPNELSAPIWSIENTSPSNLAVQDVLGEVATHSIIPKKSMLYNARLHTYEYKEKLFDGYSSPTSQYYNMAEGREDPWTVYVHIKTDEKNVVVKKVDIGMVSTSEKKYKHLYYFSYPDSRAYKMEIFDGNKKITLKLSPNPYKNEAVYVEIKAVDVRAEGLLYQDVPAISDISWGDAGNEPDVNNGVERKNVLKVSAVDNPFYFPTAQTYKFEGDIVGLASNAEAISTGQFGQFPLFVFTKTGIWAMQVDTSGKGAYTTQSPFSREVCDGAVCPVSGGVVFSTERGVMAISGGQVADLSAVLDGFEVDFFDYNSEMWNAIFAKADKSKVLNPAPIRKYIKGALIAYNYLYNEIIVSNPAFIEDTGGVPYSYVYSLTNKVWSVIDTVFDLTTNKYPELVVFWTRADKRFEFKDGYGANYVAAITRPFTLGSFDFKRLRQAGLRTTYKGDLYFYVLGSIDGAEFKCITGREYDSLENESGVQRDLITAMCRSKQYKYFAIAVVGEMAGRVSVAELLVDAGFANNKIR